MDTKPRKELLVIKILGSGLRAKDLITGEILSLKTKASVKVCELDTIVFEIDKEWTFKKQNYASGKVLSNQFVVSNIGADKLQYRDSGTWNPHEMYGDEAEEYFADYIREGYRNSYVFENYSGYGFYGEDSDPVSEAAELWESGDGEGAYDLLTKLWETYPECIDALAHLGLLYFDRELFLNRSYNCYKAAVDIAERGMPENMDGIFLWGYLENRPYLRALQGLCLVQWRKKEFDEALKTAQKLLRTCPGDNVGVRCIFDKIKNHEEWQPE